MWLNVIVREASRIALGRNRADVVFLKTARQEGQMTKWENKDGCGARMMAKHINEIINFILNASSPTSFSFILIL